ncbi:MAG: SBBP repeat-containing protein [Acidobacteriota bacterium]
MNKFRNAISGLISPVLTLFVIFNSTFLISSATIIEDSQALSNTDTTESRHFDDRNHPFANKPLSFEENKGQIDSRAKFIARGSGYELFLTGNQAQMILRGQSKNVVSRLSMEVVGADAKSTLAGVDEMPYRSHYLVGRDSAKWKTNVSHYARVKCEGIYDGIDMVYYSREGQLEYDFLVAAGSDPNVIRLAFKGASSIFLDADESLVLKTASGEVRQQKPFAYQEAEGVKREVACRYVIKGDQVGFVLGDYDQSKALVIDPAIRYSTYLGGSMFEMGYAVALDPAGNAYVTGWTDSIDFPASSGAFQTTNAGGTDAYVAKFDPKGQLVYCTYLGGSDTDQGLGIAVTDDGAAYVTGYTVSPDLPLQSPLQPFRSGPNDGFVSKLTPGGDALIYSTYLGGSDGESGHGIAMDADGNAYVTGWTSSTDFPTANPFQAALGGAIDAFVSKLNSSGSALIYSTYLGGSGFDEGRDIAVGRGIAPIYNAYVTGRTDSTDFPVRNAFQPAKAGSADAFVTKMTADGSALDYSTYLGGGDFDEGRGIAVSSMGDANYAYITGVTRSVNFPVRKAFQPLKNGPSDAFVTKLNASGDRLVFSTYLGGRGLENDEFCGDIGVDSAGNVYATGYTTSLDFPLKRPFQTTSDGMEAFAVKFKPRGKLSYSSYLGGNDGDFGLGIAVTPGGAAVITGSTSSTDFPMRNPWQGAIAGFSDSFLTKINDVGVPAP